MESWEFGYTYYCFFIGKHKKMTEEKKLKTNPTLPEDMTSILYNKDCLDGSSDRLLHQLISQSNQKFSDIFLSPNDNEPSYLKPIYNAVPVERDFERLNFKVKSRQETIHAPTSYTNSVAKALKIDETRKKVINDAANFFASPGLNHQIRFKCRSEERCFKTLSNTKEIIQMVSNELQYIQEPKSVLSNVTLNNDTLTYERYGFGRSYLHKVFGVCTNRQNQHSIGRKRTQWINYETELSKIMNDRSPEIHAVNVDTEAWATYGSVLGTSYNGSQSIKITGVCEHGLFNGVFRIGKSSEVFTARHYYNSHVTMVMKSLISGAKSSKSIQYGLMTEMVKQGCIYPCVLFNKKVSFISKKTVTREGLFDYYTPKRLPWGRVIDIIEEFRELGEAPDTEKLLESSKTLLGGIGVLVSCDVTNLQQRRLIYITLSKDPTEQAPPHPYVCFSFYILLSHGERVNLYVPTQDDAVLHNNHNVLNKLLALCLLRVQIDFFRKQRLDVQQVVGHSWYTFPVRPVYTKACTGDKDGKDQQKHSSEIYYSILPSVWSLIAAFSVIDCNNREIMSFVYDDLLGKQILKCWKDLFRMRDNMSCMSENYVFMKMIETVKICLSKDQVWYEKDFHI